MFHGRLPDGVPYRLTSCPSVSLMVSAPPCFTTTGWSGTVQARTPSSFTSHVPVQLQACGGGGGNPCAPGGQQIGSEARLHAVAGVTLAVFLQLHGGVAAVRCNPTQSILYYPFRHKYRTTSG